MIIWINRVILLLSLIAIAFLFTRSEQLGTLESKVVSLDFSPDGRKIAVAMNHALWKYDDQYKKKLDDFTRRISLIDLETDEYQVVYSEPIPVEGEIDYVEEWLRILVQRPNYDSDLMPYSPVQFLANTNRLAYYNFETGSVETYDIDSGESRFLIKLEHAQGKRELTKGWFIIPPDGLSIFVEDTDLQLHRYGLDTESLEVKLPLGEPFYVNSQNLSWGPFIDLRVLGNIQQPTPIYGASRNPIGQELAVSTVLQICFVKFDGRIPRRLLSHRLEVGSTILYSPDGKLMAAVHRDIIRFFSVDQQKTLKVVNNAERLISAFAVSPDSRYFATGDNYGKIRIWDTKNFELLATHSFNIDWRVHWLVPYGALFAWILYFIATFRTGKKKSKAVKDVPAESAG